MWGDQLGGKLAQTIPWERLAKAVWEMEVQRFLKQELIKVQLRVSMTQEKMEQLFGRVQPKIIPFTGHERVIPALDYLKAAKSEHPMATGKQVVILRDDVSDPRHRPRGGCAGLGR
ncbi:MAG: hypothetical protein CDV28_1092 [Candidatus Electronema aureum]|uniref:Uncharacterized protein n=1 Tax=Candidatus Electronema aureum TaxID=2005002 RepID=A0A521G2E2_9BACT|nr:MAG: hypothetical protein CDV28_1092 [Candidatus Electronema aureum]